MYFAFVFLISFIRDIVVFVVLLVLSFCYSVAVFVFFVLFCGVLLCFVVRWCLSVVDVASFV